MFTHNLDYRNHFPKLKRIHFEGNRYYYEEGSNILMPSTTTVISYASKHKFASWENKIGLEQANKIRKQACDRGNRLHKVIEVYLQNKNHTALDEWKFPLIQLMFPPIKWHLDTRVDNIYGQELQMLSRKLKVAGTLDLIGEIDRELAIADYKGSSKPKPREWMESYFVQMAAYWAMFVEFTGIVPKKLVVFVICEDGTIQIEEEKNIMKYLTLFHTYLKKFYADHSIPNLNELRRDSRCLEEGVQ